MDNEGTVAFITGANRGIGLETARQLGRKGIAVVIGARDRDKGKAAAEMLQAEGLNAVALQFDVVNSADHEAAYRFFDSRYGKLDILVNNAAISYAGNPDPADKSVLAASTIPSDFLQAVFDTNFFAVVALTRTLLPLIEKSPAGRIVNLSSILASLTLHADPASSIYDSKTFAYDVSKTALNAYTIHLAYDLRNTTVKVNSAHPGWVKTDMGGPEAPLEIVDGAKTTVALATLPQDGPTGGFFHMDEPLPW